LLKLDSTITNNGGDAGNQAFVRKDAELYWTLLISWGNGGKLQVGDKGLAALSVS
jgi:hypothetical protein